MLKTVLRVSAVLLFIFALFPSSAGAQISPTNSATISGSVSDSTGKPVINAQVSLSGPKSTSTQTDAQGFFVFIGVPFGTYSISATATGLVTATKSVSVQGDVNVAIQYEPASQNGLKVIANVSSNANAQFNVTPASITQVNPIANAFEGKTSWRTILEQIPGVAHAGLGNGGGSYANTVDSPAVPVQVAIDGALPYETATLLDDMPLIGAGPTTVLAGTGTNLALYPLNGFGSADVVRGPGAGAPSIVDSIGGSFLLHTPGVVDRTHYDFSVSTDPYGGIVTNALIAVRWKKLSAVVTYGVNDSPGPLNHAGVPSGTYFEPSTLDGHAFSCIGSCAYSPKFDPNYTGYSIEGFSQGLLQCCFNQTAAWNQHSGSVTLTYALSPSISTSVFYAGETSLMPSLCTGLYAVNFMPPTGYTGSIAPGVHYLSTVGGNGGTNPESQSSSLVEEKITAALGRGILRLAALQNRTWSSSALNTFGSSTVQLFGQGAICSNTDPTCTGGTYVQTVFNGGTYTATYSPTAFDCYVALTSNNRDLLLSYATPLGDNLHAGVSFVKSFYNSEDFFVCNYGAPYNFSFSQQTASLNNTQTTDELRFFVGGNPSEKTSLDLSMYIAGADYHVQNPNDPTGATFTDERYTYTAPRLGFVWRPTAAIAIRAAAGGGFAEAPLGDLVGSNGVPQPNSLTSPNFYTVSLTNLNLRPETSFAFDLGTDIRLHRGVVLSFDVYRSNLYGQLYTSSTLTGTYTGSAGTLPLYTTQFGNLSKSRYEGVLLDLSHDIPHGIYWSLSGGLTRGYVVSVPPGFYNQPGQICNVATNTNCTNQTVVPNINFNGTFAASIPYAQGLGRLGYRWNPEKYVDLVGTYYGNNNTYFRSAFVEFDGDVGYPITKNASLLVAFRNITGIYDNPLQIYSPSDLSGAPTISGLPYVLHGEMYGPRTVILTLGVRL